MEMGDLDGRGSLYPLVEASSRRVGLYRKESHKEGLETGLESETVYNVQVTFF